MCRSFLTLIAAILCLAWVPSLVGQENPRESETVRWGPENPSGIRLGVTLENGTDEYFAGQLVRPLFHFRNDTEEAIDFSHPTIVQAVWLIAEAKDQSGNSVEVDQLQQRAWVAGAIAGKLEPGDVGTVYGSMIRIGGSDYGDANGDYQMAVRAGVGQQLQLNFQLDDFIAGIPTAKTGSLSFRVVDPIEKAKELMENIGDWTLGEFRSADYMKVASILMSLEPEARVELMKEFCKSHNDPMIIFCRMLFQEPDGKTIRRPRIGMPEFWAGGMDDWTKEPIEIVGQVPFLITSSYGGSGPPESARVYLSYCLSKEFGWTSNRYYLSSSQQLSHALTELGNSRKWSDRAQEFLNSQIEVEER